MSLGTHLAFIAVAVVVVLVVLRLVASRQLRSKYALLWLLVALALVVVALFPSLINRFADVVGVKYAPTLFLLLALAVLGGLVGHLTWEVSRLETRIRTLAEDGALLRNEVDELRGRLDNGADR
ncbi:MAG: DUF2304 family protein [Actinomycetes bacterium]